MSYGACAALALSAEIACVMQEIDVVSAAPHKCRNTTQPPTEELSIARRPGASPPVPPTSAQASATFFVVTSDEFDLCATTQLRAYQC